MTTFATLWMKGMDERKVTCTTGGNFIIIYRDTWESNGMDVVTNPSGDIGQKIKATSSGKYSVSVTGTVRYEFKSSEPTSTMFRLYTEKNGGTPVSIHTFTPDLNQVHANSLITVSMSNIPVDLDVDETVYVKLTNNQTTGITKELYHNLVFHVHKIS